MLRERIREIGIVISNSEDLDCVEVLEDLVESAAEYVKDVNVLEGGILIAKYYKDGEDYRNYIEGLDKERTSAHNELIANVKIINRLCKKYNLSPIYNGDEEDRIAIANFGFELVKEIFSTRRL